MAWTAQLAPAFVRLTGSVDFAAHVIKRRNTFTVESLLRIPLLARATSERVRRRILGMSASQRVEGRPSAVVQGCPRGLAVANAPASEQATRRVVHSRAAPGGQPQAKRHGP